MNAHAQEREDLRRSQEASKTKIAAATVDFLKGARKQIHASHGLSQSSREKRPAPGLYRILFEDAKNA